MALSRSLHKFCVCGAALLMLASTGAGIASNVTPVNARRVRTHRVYKHRSRRRIINHRRYRRRAVKHATKRSKRSKRNSAKKIPWKRAWNKFMRYNDESAYTTDSIFTPKLSNRRAKDYGPRSNNNQPYYREWNNFYNKNVNKHSINNSALSFPQFEQLSRAETNVGHEKQHKAYLLEFPLMYPHAGGVSSRYDYDDDRNSEMLANDPLHGYTSHMIRDWYRIATPATNGQRILTSFSRYMHRNHNHPYLKVQGHYYVYNGHDFVPSRGKNGYGKSYVFNPKTNRYRLISTKRIDHKINQVRQNVENQLNNNVSGQYGTNKSVKTQQPQTIPMYTPTDQAFLNQANNDPVLSQSTKDTIRKILINPLYVSAKQGLVAPVYKDSSNNVDKQGLVKNPAKVYKEASTSNEVSKPQKLRLNYMSNHMQLRQNAYKRALQHKNRRNVQRDIMILTENGAFNGMSNNEYSRTVARLCAHPNDMLRAMKKYNTTVNFANNPKKVIKQARRVNRNKSLADSGEHVITSDHITARDIALLTQELNQLKAQDFLLTQEVNQIKAQNTGDYQPGTTFTTDF